MRTRRTKLLAGAALAVTAGLVSSAAPSTAAPAPGEPTAAAVGVLAGWGQNVSAQLGDGSERDKYAPVLSTDVTDLVAVSAGQLHGIGLKSDGRMVAWGTNDDRQLGDGRPLDRLRPVSVLTLQRFQAVSSGWWHNLALENTGRHVYAWGSDEFDQLGAHQSGTQSEPQLVLRSDISEVESGGTGGVSIKAVAAANAHSLALLADGTVRAWGTNGSGQLGDGTTALKRETPLPVEGIDNAVAVAGGSAHSLAVLADGTVMAWGANEWGQLGDGTTTGRLTPVRVEGLTDVVAVAAGSHSSLALHADGTVSSWGINNLGQLGDGTTTDRLTPVRIPTLTGVKAIDADSSSAVAVLNDGTARAWGANRAGQLGMGQRTDRETTPVPVTGLTGIRSVSVGSQFMIAAAG